MAGRLRAALAGRYHIERELGQGGMAVVFLARDLKHERRVALKVLRPEVSATLGPERFLREIKLAAGLAHPHILPLHDSGEADGLLYYVMPFAEGESLRERLVREGRLGLRAALTICREVADGLDYAHAQGVVHRDIKPENILLSAGHAVVSDFGIALAIKAAGGGRRTTAGVAIGTPEYMSPEQGAADSAVDGRSDVYSLACVVFEMLAGRPPFAGTAQSVLAQQVAVPPPSLAAAAPGVPPGIAAAVHRALAEQPGERYATAGAFAADLEAQAAGLARRQWRLPIGAVVILAAIAALLRWAGPTARPAGGAAAASPDPSHVAVLYFDDRSLGRAVPEVAAGLTEDLIDQLGSVSPLRVISAGGVRPYRGTSVPLDSIARALDVGSLVTGTVTRDGDRLRVTVRLIDPGTGVQLRSETIDRPWTDLLAIRDSMIDDVATMLRKGLGREVRVRERREGTHSADAWRLVQLADPLPGQAADRLRSGERTAAWATLQRADSLLTAAAELDPAWLEPPVQRARLAFTRAMFRWEEGQLPGRSAELLRADSPTGRAFSAEIAHGVQQADRALTAHPGAPEALEVRGRLRFTLWSYFGRPHDDSLLGAAEGDLHGAVLGDSTRAVAWFTLSELYRALGRLEDADAAAQAALRADAYLDQAATVYADLFFSALYLEHWADAREWCARGVRRYPTRPSFVDCRLRILGWTGSGPGDIASAWRELSKADALDSSQVLETDRLLLVAAVIARSALADSARAVLGAAHRTVANPYVAVDMSYAEAYVHLLLGERGEALRLLRAYLDANPQERGSTAQHPWWRALRGDPQFTRLVRAGP
ncbi:MAG TPA: serine/threonine-protein kinase [Gemmatimonadales bacterium]